jgi:hypothetical protein
VTVSESRYHVSPTYKVLDGHDIYRSNNLIVALVVVESQFGRDLRLYRWMKRKDQWKVDLCRMGVGRWKWDEISAKAREFIAKYGLAGTAQTQNDEIGPA